MTVEFAFLADRVDAIPTIARWYFEEWGHLAKGDSIERTRDRIESYLNRDEIPFILVVTNNNQLVGAAQLRYREMAEMYPDKEHWLGGVYVAASYRGQGYGVQIIERVVEMAPRYGVETLHLQTQALNGGVYARLGWTPCAQVTNHGVEVLVMERRLPPG
ncbi:MAG: GNAT family N-acetyltransferase [Woeseiaceae bacterium]